ncbi:hypothetical protein FIA58_004450 [Flavobacterium jejuense]|uniref:Uncharacterized protein n=1 Tax=Flavobacterium jejuense TaxID=1544455 RepID=A0ABX0IMU5_9FLAO|nr:hypothetical protein [Flavobacterium jejuense]NHN24921.1 hypothetical protein [Flavobacterium jejuense]
MNSIYKKFYRTFYTRTNYIPSKPLNKTLFPGDFFHIINGEMIILGNIFSANIVDTKTIDFDHNVKLNIDSWKFSDGVTKPYSGRGTGNNAIDGVFEFSKQILAFESCGSFFFTSNEPEAVKIKNWSELKNELIIKLTQTYFSFRELYLITETASTSDWTLAISSSKNGELEIAVDTENFGLVDIFGHSSSKTIQSKDIEYYNRQSERKPSFFKAKKLVEQNETLQVFIDELIYQRTLLNRWGKDFYKYNLNANHEHDIDNLNNAQISILDLLPGNQLNPNTALLYFKWVDTSLDDIEKLFVNYEI